MLKDGNRLDVVASLEQTEDIDIGEEPIWESYSNVYDLMSDLPFVKDLRERHVK